ncbi:MAG TPA: ABC transporter permease [Gemmatimonadaceae bacterium]|nr:ABC transporter permease [Gemmatimonadaceae bacterium]
MPVTATLRSLRNTRGLSATVVATLAFGVAALALAFGVINAAVFREPPFHDAGRLAMLYLERNPQGEPPRRERWSFPRYELLRERQQSFERVASYSPASLTISGEHDAELVQGERVSASYFPLLRVGPARGRLFTEAEDDPARPTPVVLLGHGLWTRRWGADSAILGRTIRLNGVTLTVIGVLPAGFTGLSGRAEVWIPRTTSPQITYAEYLTTNQNFISAVGRLRTGVSLPAAQSELELLGASINRALPSDPDFPDERVTASATTLNEARANPTVRRSLFVLLGAVVVLHLLACANVTNLLLGRAAVRQHESAVRVALGSSPRRLFRHLLGEGLVLTGAGGASGVVLAWWASGFVTPPANAWAPRNFYGSLAPFDAPAFRTTEVAFAVGIAVLTALLVAIPPALSAFRVNVAAGIKAQSRGIPGGALTLRRPSARGVLVGLEAALAMLLVVAAGLLIDSFQRMRRVDLGVRLDNVLTFWVIPSEARVPPPAAPAFVTKLLAAVARVPGVVSASVDGGAPLAGSASNVLFIEGRTPPTPGQAPPVLRHYVGPDHFATLDIPLRRGRVFTAGDGAGAPGVAVISETAARRFWPGEDPLGQRVWFSGSGFDSPAASAEIVGIVGDVVYNPLDRRPNLASVYTPYAQFTYASRMVFARTAPGSDPLAVIPAIRQSVATVDPELALQEVQPLAAIVSASWARNRFDAILFGGFGVAALVLAASGIFAVLSYGVATRTREFGVRMALGADSRRVLWDVLREGMAWPIAGLAIGLAAALGITRLLQSSLYETSPQEPHVLVGTAALLVIVAAAACLVPSWRATRVDAMEALRAE